MADSHNGNDDGEQLRRLLSQARQVVFEALEQRQVSRMNLRMDALQILLQELTTNGPPGADRYTFDTTACVGVK